MATAVSAPLAKRRSASNALRFLGLFIGYSVTHCRRKWLTECYPFSNAKMSGFLRRFPSVSRQQLSSHLSLRDQLGHHGVLGKEILAAVHTEEAATLGEASVQN